MDGQIDIRLNGEPRRVAGGQSIESLLRSLSLEPRMIVVEHNGEILRRERYAQVGVDGGDSLELVQFVGGG